MSRISIQNRMQELYTLLLEYSTLMLANFKHLLKNWVWSPYNGVSISGVIFLSSLILFSIFTLVLFVSYCVIFGIWARTSAPVIYRESLAKPQFKTNIPNEHLNIVPAICIHSVIFQLGISHRQSIHSIDIQIVVDFPINLADTTSRME